MEGDRLLDMVKRCVKVIVFLITRTSVELADIAVQSQL